jgi:hypothetical protein
MNEQEQELIDAITKDILADGEPHENINCEIIERLARKCFELANIPLCVKTEENNAKKV